MPGRRYTTPWDTIGRYCKRFCFPGVLKARQRIEWIQQYSHFSLLLRLGGQETRAFDSLYHLKPPSAKARRKARQVVESPVIGCYWVQFFSTETE